jgi:hypothetical protein
VVEAEAEAAAEAAAEAVAEVAGDEVPLTSLISGVDI